MSPDKNSVRFQPKRDKDVGNAKLRRERTKVRVVNFRLTLTPPLSHKWERERLAG